MDNWCETLKKKVILLFVYQGHEVYIVAQQHLIAVDSSLQGAILQFKYATWTDRRADSASHTAWSDDVLPFLGIGAHIDSHFTVHRTIAAGDALTAIGGNPKPGKQPLLKAQNGCHGTSKPAPNPTAKNGIKTRSDNTRENTADQKRVGFT